MTQDRSTGKVYLRTVGQMGLKAIRARNRESDADWGKRRVGKDGQMYTRVKAIPNCLIEDWSAEWDMEMRHPDFWTKVLARANSSEWSGCTTAPGTFNNLQEKIQVGYGDCSR